jgi:hypothetical protein
MLMDFHVLIRDGSKCEGHLDWMLDPKPYMLRDRIAKSRCRPTPFLSHKGVSLDIMVRITQN